MANVTSPPEYNLAGMPVLQFGPVRFRFIHHIYDRCIEKKKLNMNILDAIIIMFV